MTAVAAERTGWASLGADERRAARIASWRSGGGTEFESEAAAEAYRERVDIFVDAVRLEKLPARVPILAGGTFMPGDLAGVTPYEMMYDVDRLIDASLRYVVEYEPDYYRTPLVAGLGPLFELLDCRQFAWPGHGVAETSGYQYREGEYMHVDEYDALIDDPSDFSLRVHLPRVFGAFEPLQRVPPLTDLWMAVGATGALGAYGADDVQQALATLMEAGRLARAVTEKVHAFDETVKAKGFASSFGGFSEAPFDMLADTLRGTRAAMLDMHRRPERILEAVERLTPLAIKQGVAVADRNDNPVVFLPLHKGADGFMSDAQFARFYWPSLKAVCLGLIEHGCIPFLFCEGGYETRLEYLQELPPGTCVCLFDKTDMVRAKHALEGRVCVAGNVQSSLILTGTAAQVEACCRRLIDEVAPGGGYMMSFGTGMDEGKPETVHAMIDVTRAYGVYA